MPQDDFYLSTEGNAFFDRWFAKNSSYNGELRFNKKTILLKLEKENLLVENSKVLEIGCFVGDLLNHMKEKYDCKIFGVETSSKACSLGKKLFNVNINHKYCGHMMKYTVPNPIKTLNFSSDRGHFTAR